LGRNASDIHVQPLPDRTIVRYRVDGVLHDVRELAPELAVAVVSRVKVMGRMDIAERRVPQDGRATVTIGERPIDLRISTVPTSHGERAVLRLLDHSRQLTDFSSIGMPERIAGPYLERANRSNGILLVTGPTGSGKTTTLYATITKIGTAKVNIMTVEDPIEYELSFGGPPRQPVAGERKKGRHLRDGPPAHPPAGSGRRHGR
jgi:general secretion pathway protein E